MLCFGEEQNTVLEFITVCGGSYVLVVQFGAKFAIESTALTVVLHRDCFLDSQYPKSGSIFHEKFRIEYSLFLFIITYDEANNVHCERLFMKYAAYF